MKGERPVPSLRLLKETQGDIHVLNTSPTVCTMDRALANGTSSFLKNLLRKIMSRDLDERRDQGSYLMDRHHDRSIGRDTYYERVSALSLSLRRPGITRCCRRGQHLSEAVTESLAVGRGRVRMER